MNLYDGGGLADLHRAAIFLTRLPLPEPSSWPEGALARAMRAFPLVGGVIGLLAGMVTMLAWAVLPPVAAVLLGLGSAILITGALHEDGLADFADGLGARGGRERRLEVMRDSAIGVFGVLALILALALKTSALAAAPDAWEAAGAMIAAAALSRALIPALMQILPPARKDGLGAGAGEPHAGIAAQAAILGLGLAMIGVGPAGAALAAITALAVVLGLAALARRSLGGYTGDVLGASQQAAETAILLAAASVWG